MIRPPIRISPRTIHEAVPAQVWIAGYFDLELSRDLLAGWEVRRAVRSLREQLIEFPEFGRSTPTATEDEYEVALDGDGAWAGRINLTRSLIGGTFENVPVEKARKVVGAAFSVVMRQLDIGNIKSFAATVQNAWILPDGVRNHTVMRESLVCDWDRSAFAEFGDATAFGRMEMKIGGFPLAEDHEAWVYLDLPANDEKSLVITQLIVQSKSLCQASGEEVVRFGEQVGEAYAGLYARFLERLLGAYEIRCRSYLSLDEVG
jgi:hypothetical protein